MSFLEPGNPVRIKICGITSPADAEMAVDAGADALGFNFYRGSKRCISFEESRAWIDIACRAGLSGGGGGECRQWTSSTRCATPGASRPCNSTATKLLSFVRVRDFRPGSARFASRARQSLEDALRYDTPYLLLDAWSEAAYGGTGRHIDWDLVREFVAAQPAKQVILAGGLGPENVREAIRIVQPHALMPPAGSKAARDGKPATAFWISSGRRAPPEG